MNDQWRIGGGIRSATSTKLSASGAVNNLNTSFESSVGAVIEAEYFMNEKSSIKIRAVNEKYKAKGYSDSYSGAHVGATFNYYF